MRKVALTAFVVLAFLALAMYMIASASSISMAMLPQAHSPASLVETTHTNEDFLASAKLHNSAAEPIGSYRIGWVALHSEGGSTVTLGEPVNVPVGITADSTAIVPAQAVDPAKFRHGNRSLGFFVAEARFANGQTWKANLTEIQRQAGRQ